MKRVVWSVSFKRWKYKLESSYDYQHLTGCWLRLLETMYYLGHNVVHDQLSVGKKRSDELEVIKSKHVDQVDLNVVVYYEIK